MKTTIIGVGKTGTMVLDNCRELADTEFVYVSDNEVKKAAGDSELIISIAVATPAESERLHDILNTADSIVLDFVIPPFGSEFPTNEYHTTGRNVFFLPQQPKNISDEAGYYEYCVSEAVGCIKLLKRIVDSMDSADNYISIDKADLISLLNSCENENSKFIIHVEGDFDRCINDLKNNSLISSDTAAILIMSYLPKTTLVADWNRFGEITRHDEMVVSCSAFVDDTDKTEIIALIVNRI